MHCWEFLSKERQFNVEYFVFQREEEEEEKRQKLFFFWLLVIQTTGLDGYSGLECDNCTK